MRGISAKVADSMIALFASTIFTAAALLFVVQPLFARMVLPLLGGAPAVWNTAMVFYQAILLAGYAFAHFSMRLGLRRQVLLQFVVLLVPIVTLPLGIPEGWEPSAEGSPSLWMFGLMAVAVGPALFAVSSTSPVLQRWFSVSGHARARDPYFLYAASNAGSLLALLAYPAVLEPGLRLASQSTLWTWGYGVLVLLSGLSALVAWRGAADRAAPLVKPSGAPIAVRRRLRWIGLALVPSGLMLGVTNYISSDVAVVPLMWIVPLSLYLLSFVLVFAPRTAIPRSLVLRTLPILLVPLLMAFNMGAISPIGPLMLLHLSVFFVAALLCHGALADDRPEAGRLTEFYLWLAVGGVLGGAGTALVAPLIFNSVAEYPILLVLACIAGMTGGRLSGPDRVRPGDVAWGVAVGLGSTGLIYMAGDADLANAPLLVAGIFGVPALLCYFLSSRPFRFSIAVAALLASGQFRPGDNGEVLMAERSFFGVHRFSVEQNGAFKALVHGRTLHGRQSTDPAKRGEPLAYYHRTGPAGQLIGLFASNPATRVAAVGLGAGSVAAYALPGQPWTFFEIDPLVLELASDVECFTYLADSNGSVRTVLGDARLTLARETADSFGLIILDAYSSDAIPVHLVTREAFALYLEKLAPGGALAFHISNLHLDLEPVFADLARDAGLVALTRDDTALTAAEQAEGKSPSVWMVMARSQQDLAALAGDVRWQPSREGGRPAWTDDHSSLLRVIRWR